MPTQDERPTDIDSLDVLGTVNPTKLSTGEVALLLDAFASLRGVWVFAVEPDGTMIYVRRPPRPRRTRQPTDE